MATEFAFLDVREHGQYGEGHPFFSVPFPFSRIEALAEELLPCRSTALYLLDDGDHIGQRAGQVLEALGFDNVHILDGGAPGWDAAGYTLYKGVNVVSKTYGELLEHVADTPRLTATEAKSLLDRDSSVVVLDGRSPAEYRKMSLPGATCCPNAELGYRIQSIVPDETTPVIINCAGRTRSILGVEGLRVLGFKNPLFALENGTQGWRLAGLDLEHGVAPQLLPQPDAAQLAVSAERARQLIRAANLPLISAPTIDAWLADTTRTTYLLDVRTRDEFELAHWPGARHAPGGQLVQATDQYVAVRNARIVLSDDNRLRAATTAIRLQDMGHDVYLLDVPAGDGSCKLITNDAVEKGNFPTPADLAEMRILDASAGMDFRAAHIDGAEWANRARLARMNIAANERLFVTGREDGLVHGVVAELSALGAPQITSCAGSPQIWADAGFDLVASPDTPTDEQCIDYLFFVHDRHDDNMDAARRYLAWETGLVDQLDAQERSILNPRAHFDLA